MYVAFQVTKKMEGVTKALDKAMASMDLEKVFLLFFLLQDSKMTDVIYQSVINMSESSVLR